MKVRIKGVEEEKIPRVMVGSRGVEKGDLRRGDVIANENNRGGGGHCPETPPQPKTNPTKKAKKPNERGKE